MSLFICDICDSKFEFKFEIIVHLNDHQNGSIKTTNRKSSANAESPHLCVVCGKRFTRRIILEKHEKTHYPQTGDVVRKTIKANYSCDFCGKKYTRKAYLKAHTSIHTQESQHKCDHCDKLFTRKEHLVYHTRMHTGETPFKCELCSKEFTSKKSLKAHSGTQCLRKDLVCPVCLRSFERRASLTNHINRSHCTEGKFKCDECGKCFAVNQNLIMHMTSHKM